MNAESSPFHPRRRYRPGRSRRLENRIMSVLVADTSS
jgi:hypothetical protein